VELSKDTERRVGREGKGRGGAVSFQNVEPIYSGGFTEGGNQINIVTN